MLKLQVHLLYSISARLFQKHADFCIVIIIFTMKAKRSMKLCQELHLQSLDVILVASLRVSNTDKQFASSIASWHWPVTIPQLLIFEVIINEYITKF